MIAVKDEIDVESSTRKGEKDVYAIFSNVDLKTKKVTFTAATLRRGGSTVPEHTLDLRYVLNHVFNEKSLEISALALALDDRRACCHCGSDETADPADLCESCCDLIGDQGAPYALECAAKLKAYLDGLAESDPVMRDELAPMRSAIQSLVNDSKARVLREQREAVAAQ